MAVKNLLLDNPELADEIEAKIRAIVKGEPEKVAAVLEDTTGISIATEAHQKGASKRRLFSYKALWPFLPALSGLVQILINRIQQL